MDTSKVTAIVLAVLVAALVIIAGKSCTDDISSSNQKAHRSTKSQISTVATEQYIPPMPTAAPTEAATDAPTVPYEVVTNMIGEVIETIPIQTTMEGIETLSTETTGTKSILEQYDEAHQTTIADNNGQPEATTKYIEPARDIVIEIG